MSGTPIRAAQYVRMSTERQDLSVEFQTIANLAYAAERGIEVVRTYADEGISGLRIERREGLKRLLADVLGGEPGFSIILVYDVSRWGRFQNPDEAGHYEFLCREAQVRIHYTAEPFINDDTVTAHLMKHVRRAMAAEYSRDLSEKTKRAKAVLTSYGYWSGGPPGYGLRRQVVTRSGDVLGNLESGHFKAHRGGRTRIVLGPAEEVETVRRIFRLYVQKGWSCARIANVLNSEGVSAAPQRSWCRDTISGILTSQRYAGTLVFGKEVHELGRCVERPPPEKWKRIANACPAIISGRMFLAAQRVRKARREPISNEVLIADLRRLLATEGTLSQSLMRKRFHHGATIYVRRFGSLIEAFRLVGYEPGPKAYQGRDAARIKYAGLGHWPHMSDDAMYEGLRALLAREGRLSRTLIDADPAIPPAEVYRQRLGSLDDIYRAVGYTPTGLQARRIGPVPPTYPSAKR